MADINSSSLAGSGITSFTPSALQNRSIHALNNDIFSTSIKTELVAFWRALTNANIPPNAMSTKPISSPPKYGFPEKQRLVRRASSNTRKFATESSTAFCCCSPWPVKTPRTHGTSWGHPKRAWDGFKISRLKLSKRQIVAIRKEMRGDYRGKLLPYRLQRQPRSGQWLGHMDIWA